MTLRNPLGGALVMAALWLGSGHAVIAQPRCDELPNPLYVQFADTQEPLIKALGRSLRSSKANPITLIYLASGSCATVQAIYTDVKLTANPKYIPSEEEDKAWTPADPSPTCVIPDGGRSVELAGSALFASTCDPQTPPNELKLFRGPNQGFAFTVPEASTEVAITAEEAYFTFGFGSAGMVTPWDDENQLMIRPPARATVLVLGLAIHVPAAKWKGKPQESSNDALNAVASATAAEKTLGILGTEIYDKNRDKANVLAYRSWGQKHAYFPDSTSSSFDKRNLRDGHYVPWAPTEWITKADASGKPLNDKAAYFLGLLLGKEVSPKADFEPLEAVVSAGLVPDCAMHVTRTEEMGDLSPYEAAEPCDCYFESVVGTAPERCAERSDDKPCETGTCRRGFCEAR